VLQFTAIQKIVCRQTSAVANAGVALFAPWDRVAQAILFGVLLVSLLPGRFTIAPGPQLLYDRQPDYFPRMVWICSSKAALKFERIVGSWLYRVNTIKMIFYN
jgi:hypothetical protein